MYLLIALFDGGEKLAVACAGGSCLVAGIEHIGYFGVIFIAFCPEQTVQRSVWIYQHG